MGQRYRETAQCPDKKQGPSSFASFMLILVTRGSVFDDLGFDADRALELKIKEDIILAIRQHVERRKYTQGQLVAVLRERQPRVSRLLNGRINSITIDELLRYTERLGPRYDFDDY